MKTDADQTLTSLLLRIFKKAPVGLCFLDTELRYVYINDWLAAINGRSVDEHLGRTVAEVLPSVATGIESLLRHVIETGEPVLEGTVVAETPANPGERKCFEHNYYPVKSGGSIVGVSCAVRDITDRKRAQEALCKARDELEMRVEQRTTELEEANERLQHEIIKREQAEKVRWAIDERLRLLLESTRAVPWMADASTWQFTYVGPQIVTLLGYPVENWYEQDFWVDHIHPDDRKWAVDFCQKSSQQLQDYDFQYRMLASDERIVWIHDIVNVKWIDGVPAILQGFMMDISEHKQAEQALKHNQEELRMATGKLLTVQEVERQRIARELHDDISQRLAALTMDTATIEQQLGVSPQSIPERLHELQANIVKISQDVHGLSRRLHPSILQDLGLVRAVRSECKTVADRDGLAVEVTDDGDFSDLPQDQALCLYRILQESLRNIAKHAHTKSARVLLVRRDGMALLTIEDDGIGFDPEQGRARAGLGLVSMEERVRLIGGQFFIQSTRGKGTRVEVRISFEANGNESSTITPG